MITWQLPSNILYWLGITSFILAIISSIILFGGWWYPVFSIPTLILLGLSLTFLSLSATVNIENKTQLGEGIYGTSPLCVGTILAFSCYVYWRISNTPEHYIARENLWLLISGLGTYFVAMLYLKKDSTYWVVLLALITIALGELGILVWQYTSVAPIHPLHQFATWFNLPDGKSGINHGYVSGTFFARGGLSAFLVIVFLWSISATLWSKCHIAIKMLLLWVCLFCLAGIGLTMSRAAYLATGFGFLTFISLSLLLLARYGIVKSWVTLSIAFVIIIPSLLIGYTLATENFAITQRLRDIGSDTYRENLWISIIPSVMNKTPLIGLGANSFDAVSIKLGDPQLGRSVHAHNDWLQLLVEYGLIGLVLALLSYITHIITAITNSYRLASEVAYQSIIPQSTQLAALIGTISSIVGVGIHSLFDYQLHLTSIVVLFALSLGLIASSTSSWNEQGYANATPITYVSRGIWVILSLCLGGLLITSGYTKYKPELLAFRSENKLLAQSFKDSHKLALEGLNTDPENPRLLTLAAESAGQYANSLKDNKQRQKWYTTSANYWLQTLKQRHNFAYATRETALALNWSGQREQALPLHLRAIGQAPNSAIGYEYLGIHFWLKGEKEKAIRLLNLAKSLPNSRLAQKYLDKIQPKAAHP